MTAGPAEGVVVAGKYRLLERVGVGGMSEVHRAEVVGTGQIVALKLLSATRHDDANLGTRLFHEAHAVDRIRHPGIVRVLDAGTSAQGPYLTMEYLDGQSAAEALADGGKLELQAALATMLPVLDALHAAHSVGVVHRDLKPGNVFYAFDPEDEVAVKLMDFGVAKSLSGSGPTPHTSTGIVMGTPDYLSPEQANGEFHLDGRSDVFAAGVVLFELLTGSRPFHAPTAIATAYKISHAKHPTLVESGGPANPVLQEIVDRALAKSPEDRFASARDLGDALRDIAGDERELKRALRRAIGRTRRGAPARVFSGHLGPATSKPRTASTLPPPDGQLSTLPPPRQSGLRARNAPAFSAEGSVRGAVLRAADQYVQRAFGSSARARVLAELDRQVADELAQNSVQAILSYDVVTITAYLDAVTAKVCSGNDAWARAAGVAAVSGELAQLLRGALRRDQPAAVLRRVARVLSRVFDLGAWDVEPTGSTATLRITELPPETRALRLFLLGVLDGALTAAGVSPGSVSTKSEPHSGPMLLVEVGGK